MITADVLEPMYGPLPIPAEVVHYNGTLLIGRDLALWPGLFQTESDVVRYNLQRALAQVEHSTTEAPEQVEHWHWVAESYRRDLVGVPSLTDIEGGPYPSSIHPEAEDIDVDALTEAWLVEQHQHVRVVLDNEGISETLPWDDLSERTKRLRRDQARPVMEFVAARVEQDVRRQQREAVEAAIQAELDLHQCSFDELPVANQRFVQGMRRALEWMTRGGSND